MQLMCGYGGSARIGMRHPYQKRSVYGPNTSPVSTLPQVRPCQQPRPELGQTPGPVLINRPTSSSDLPRIDTAIEAISILRVTQTMG